MDTSKPKRGVRRGRWFVLGIVLVIVGIVAALLVNSAQTRAAPAVDTIPVQRGNITARIAGSGTIAAAQSLDLPFQTTGSVSAVLVQAGDFVKQGQVLARLNDRALQLQVGNAQAGVESARARLAQAQEGNAKPEDLQAAEAQVANAQAQLTKTRTGNTTAADIQSQQAAIRSAQAQLAKARTGGVTAADIANAEAAVRSAEAQLNKARHGTATAADIANAEAAVRSAEAQLQKVQRGAAPDQVSQAQTTLEQARQNQQKTAAAAASNKASAEQSLLQAADNVRIAQDTYGRAYWDNDHAQRGVDPKTGQTWEEQKQDPGIQKQQYADALRNAELQLKQAESRLEQAKITLENARQSEINDVATAQVQVNNAQVQLDELFKGPKMEDVVIAQSALDQAKANLQKLTQAGSAHDVAIAQASLDQARANVRKLQQGGTPQDIAASQASLDQARANLAKLQQGGSAADIAAAQSQVDQAQANFQKLTTPATETDLDIQTAAVAQAEQSLKTAQLNLEYATLRAPFDGVVTDVAIVRGSLATTATPAVKLVDRATLHVDLKLSENDVVNVQLGQPVTLTIDSLRGWQTEGNVDYIAPAAETTNDVVTYAVRVSFAGSNSQVKVGMTANLDMITSEKNGVLVVPNSALMPKGAGRVVQLLNADGTTREVDVAIGLSDGTQTEITSNLNEGDQIVANPASDQSTDGGPFGN